MESSSKTIMVAGGAGFVGSHLCSFLLDQGHTVICLDNFRTGRRVNIAKLEQNPHFRLIEHNIIEPCTSSGPIDQIYNLACPASPPHYQKDPIFTWKTSILGTLNLLEAAESHNATFLQASTSEVYGDPAVHPQPEAYWGNVNPIGIRSCYDEGKRAAETLCADYFRTRNARVKIIRIFNTYGPNMDPRDGRVISNFIMQALKNEPITIYGQGTQTRSFQYIEDLILGMTAFMALKERYLGPVNVGNPGEFTMIELAKLILELIPESTSEIVFQALPGDDPTQRKPDISRAGEKLNWQPRIPLREGLQKTIHYFRTQL